MRSERTEQMIKNFMSLFGRGFSVKEISEKYGLAVSTIYVHLGEIASSNGLTREDLLKEVHRTPAYWERESKVLYADVEALEKSLEEAEKNIQNVINEIDKIMEDEDVKENNYEM